MVEKWWDALSIWAVYAGALLIVLSVPRPNAVAGMIFIALLIWAPGLCAAFSVWILKMRDQSEQGNHERP